MSFITKRERVFNEYDLFDLPARNEGKLKAYASCTDTRAWSHFCSDKSEHLIEIIKRNNDTCRPKYVPTEAIINTLMVGKNAEIARLKQKIEEFEQLLAAYDELELTCDQKCEIAKAHAAIKEANKELDGIWFDLDLSGFTEGIDSEAFETGKSRGDEPSTNKDDETPKSKMDEWTIGEEPPQRDTKSNQAGLSCPCDVGTSAVDPRIQDMQDTIITKDAKLNAMQNTIAVMENDVCEPYCIYAHIYTALEKIFGILCQNEKYKLYLDLMTSGKDTRCVDIKGKILFKLKVLEKFSLALIAPCSQDNDDSPNQADCSCYRAEIITREETSYALTSAETEQPSLDSKRAQLVADIMENEEMKDILSKENANLKNDLEFDESENYNIDSENLKRLKNLQESYDDLMTCYEALKHEKDCLIIRCHKYEEMEKEFESLKSQLREYNALWNEKEHYRKRSANLDALKNQYLVLSDETSNLEIQINAEHEINNVKTKTIEELRRENLQLEEKLNAAHILFEKEKNSLQYKLKESECKAMWQDQQIRSLSVQVDKLLKQDPEQEHCEETNTASIAVIDEMNSLKEQINNLKDVICENDREKRELQNEFFEQIEHVKNKYDYLKKFTNELTEENQRLMEANTILTQEVEKQTFTVNKLIDNKSLEEKALIEYVEKLNEEKNILCKKVDSLQETCATAKALDHENAQAIKLLQIACQESQELLEKVSDYNNLKQEHDNLTNSKKSQSIDYENLNYTLIRTPDLNCESQIQLSNHRSTSSIIIQQIQKLREINQNAALNINKLQDDNNEFKTSFELEKKESKLLQNKLQNLENESDQLLKFKNSHEALSEENTKLKSELVNKKVELNDAKVSIKIQKQESEELVRRLSETQSLKNQELLDEITKKTNELLQISQTLNIMKNELAVANRNNKTLFEEKSILQSDLERRTEKINDLHRTLESTIKENQQQKQLLLEKKSAFVSLKKDNDELIQSLKYYENLESEYNKLQRDHDQLRVKNNELENELHHQVNDIRRIERKNHDLSSQSESLLSQNETLEKALIDARKELVEKSSFPENPYMDVAKEIDVMKHEKLLQHQKIRDLQDKLEEMENEISQHIEEIFDRDGKISIMENHINELEDEVRKLHNNLAEVVNTRERISDHSVQKVKESFELMQAHHSRAAHNMKMELAKIQSVNSNLEETLSDTKMKNEENLRDKNKYMSQIMLLQSEREIMITDIKQLEISSVGDSVLSPERCDVKDVLASLDRIRKFLNARSSKSNSLESTLLSVHNSYHLVQTKADEAKKIVEKEKQKILNEKEEAIKDRINMEKQLVDLKKQLEQQVLHDKTVIQDLEAELLNQKLIIDKLNKSTQGYISKLEEEMKALETSYENSLQKTTYLENELTLVTSKKAELLRQIEINNIDLEKKLAEVEILNGQLAELKKNPTQYRDAQTTTLKISRNVESQTENNAESNDSDPSGKKYDYLQDIIDISSVKVAQTTHDKQYEHNIPSAHMNEVQVLTATTDPSFNYVRSCYLDYKLKLLTFGNLEHHSISSTSILDINRDQYSTAGHESSSHNEPKLENSFMINSETPNLNVIDIYNKKSILTNSSRVIDHDDIENEMIERLRNSESPNKSIAFTEFGMTNESFVTESHLNNEYKDRNLFESTSEVSTDKDLFLIYKDSDVNHDKSYEKKGPWTANGKSEVIVEAVTVHVNNHGLVNPKKYTSNMRPREKQKLDDDSFINVKDEYYDEDDSVKQKLEINIPRVETGGLFIIASDTDKMSQDSITMTKGPSPKPIISSADSIISFRIPSISAYKDENEYYTDAMSTATRNISRNIRNKIEPMDIGKNKLNNPKTRLPQGTTNENEYDHNLSRVGADVALIKTETSDKPELLNTSIPRHHRIKGIENDNHNQSRNNNNESKPKTLDRIEMFDTSTSRQRKSKNVENNSHNDHNNSKKYNASKNLRKIRSDERFYSANLQGRNDSSLEQTEFKNFYTDNKSVSSNSYSNLYDKHHSKSYIDSSVMVKLEIEEYENKIQHLTKNLENVEKDYKNKIDAIKMQYDNNIKSILNEHNQGVESIQSLHEETLEDIKKIHENEVENLRSMSIEAMRKADKLEKENRTLKNKIQDCSPDEEPTKISTPELKRRKRSRLESKLLTKTHVEAFDVEPKSKAHGPCTCSLDINVSDTIKSIFEQVDVDQRKKAEYTFMKYIANKILNGNIEVLDPQELSFLHLKVCRIWKSKINKEVSLQKRIDTLEAELMNKQKNTQHNIEELDRQVAEERRRLQVVREAVCRNTPTKSHRPIGPGYVPPVPPSTAEKEFIGGCYNNPCLDVGERRSAGDLATVPSGLRPKRTRNESNRAVLAKLDAEERREKKLYPDELPTRLRKSQTLRKK